MDTGPRSATRDAAPGRLAEALRWYLATWTAAEQGWGAVLARLAFVAAMVAVDVLVGEAAGESARGGVWTTALGARPWLAALALAGLAVWLALEVVPGLRTLERGARLRLLGLSLAWGGALLATRWPGWLEAGSVRAVWAAVLLAEAALSFRPAWRWGLHAAACGAGAGWLLAR